MSAQASATGSDILASFAGSSRRYPMSRIVRCGLIQASSAAASNRSLPEIKKAMIDKHLKLIAQAAKKKVKILCLQELFYGPYFCAEQNVRWYDLTERVPDGPTTQLMQKIAAKHNRSEEHTSELQSL